LALSALLITGGLSVLASATLWLWLPESPEFLGRKAARAAGQVTAKSPSLAWQLFSPVLLIGTLLIWVFFICAQLTNLSVLSWLPIMLEKAGRDPTFAALAITAFNAGGLLACIFVGWLIDKFGAVQVTVALVAGGALSFILIGGQLDRADRVALQLGIFIIGLFSQGAYGAINLW
jgi:MFS transporter, AAHS family, 4-hydroxybenzoate transporter